MKENSQKKVLLSVLGVAILVVAVIGISFAAYQATVNTGTTNSITTGTIMVSYTEPSNAINITDALPLSDANGIKLEGTNKTFNFTVSTHASEALTVPYTISLTRDTSSTLENSEIKVYLTKSDGTVVVGPKLVSEFAAHETRENTVTLTSVNDVYTAANEEAKTTSYILRLWVDEKVTVDSSSSDSYRALVNVDSAVAPIQ